MTPLEKLFRLEIEFHRRMRIAAPGLFDASSLHISYALQTGYEQLIPAAHPVTVPQIDQLRDRFLPACDRRDIVAASDTIKQLLGVAPLTV
jgi:hypothetical protein